MRIVTTGSERCSFCRLGEGHDGLFQAWAQGDLTAEEVEELVSMIGNIADETVDPDRREAIRELPETLGLVE